jgi:glyoxylate reductase
MGKPVVVIARVLLPAGRELLEPLAELRDGGLDASPERVRELAPGATAIVADPTVPVGPELLDAAGEGLRIVANFAVGIDNVDLDACRERGVLVSNTPDVLTNATAELALALTLAAARGASAAEDDLRAARWTGWDPGAYLGLELTGATFAVVGAGRIGRRYAELIRPLAGRLLYVSRTAKPELEDDLGAERVELADALAQADVVSLHVPHSDDTHRLIGAPELASMLPHAILVNTARGPIVDSEALAAALEGGHLGGAGLDVYEGEPAVPDVLKDAPRATLLPHIGSATHTARDAMARTAAENVLAVLHGAEPPNRVA